MTQINDEVKMAITGIADAAIALLSYVLLFKVYEKRQITELSLVNFWRNALLGFFAGLILQSLNILVIYLAGGYSITQVNPASFLIPGFIFALTAGFVAEIILRGIIFRLTEEKLGTKIALLISIFIFILIHSAGDGATVLSVLSTFVQAGILLSSTYIFTRSLWPSIFLHFAWDFAEPGIYGGINQGIKVDKSLLTSRIGGSELLTGGLFGPGNSLQSTVFCVVAGFSFLWLAKQKKNFIKAYWAK